jgi:GNAT superfamily N-acetyltransferase
MPLTFELDPPVTPVLRDGILRLWADVSNAGGAVGFVPPVTTEEVRPELVKHLVAMAEGRMRLVVGREEDGTVAATAFVAHNTHRLMKHWVWLYTVMVHPSHQGKGYGRDLMAAAEREVRGLGGIDAIRLTCRGAPASTASTPPVGTRRSDGCPARSAWPRGTTATTSSCSSR